MLQGPASSQTLAPLDANSPGGCDSMAGKGVHLL